MLKSASLAHTAENQQGDSVTNKVDDKDCLGFVSIAMGSNQDNDQKELEKEMVYLVP